MKKRIILGMMVHLCVFPAAVNAQTVLSESEYHHYIGAYDCSAKVYVYMNAYDQDGREMFEIEKRGEDDSEYMPGVETVIFYQDETKIVIDNLYGSGSEGGTLCVQKYVENKMIKYAEYEYTPDGFDTPSKELEIEYSQVGSEMVGVSKGENLESEEVTRYDQNGRLSKRENEFGYSEYQYNTKGHPIYATYGESSNRYNNIYDLEGRLIAQQMVDAESDRILYTAFFRYDTIDHPDEALVGYWIENGSSDCENRKLLAFSANGFYFTAHVNNPGGLPLVDSAGHMDISPEEGQIEYSGNYNYGSGTENGTWNYEVQEGILVLDGIMYQRV